MKMWYNRSIPFIERSCRVPEHGTRPMIDTRICKNAICAILCASAMLLAGCTGQRTPDTASIVETTEVTYEEVVAAMNESASYGGMTVTVTAAEDPGITMKDSGKKALFFELTIDNGTDETVTASYLNNFELTVDGTRYESYQCCTIPVMKEMYDFYGTEPLNEEIPAGGSIQGRLAVEANKSFTNLELHYIPKTTDRGSMITVPIRSEEIMSVSK